MATVGVKDIIANFISALIWSWNGDEAQLYTKKLDNVLYFTVSPFNIIIATALSEFMKDDEVKWVITKIEYSVFTWDFGKYKNTLFHSENCLP